MIHNKRLRPFLRLKMSDHLLLFEALVWLGVARFAMAFVVWQALNQHTPIPEHSGSSLTLADLRRQITILFQEPVHYHTTAAENIWHGDINTLLQEANIEGAAQAAGADTPINRLPQRYETILGKWFGGAELSVGEWQRVALARAFLRQAPIIILDEPTSAMDSWAEADWMARFRDLTAERTSIIITHRFTTAMQADIIHVMMAGQIVESGNHQELLALGGRYAQSWRAQMGSTTLYM